METQYIHKKCIHEYMYITLKIVLKRIIGVKEISNKNRNKCNVKIEENGNGKKINGLIIYNFVNIINN